MSLFLSLDYFPHAALVDRIFYTKIGISDKILEKGYAIYHHMHAAVRMPVITVVNTRIAMPVINLIRQKIKETNAHNEPKS